MPPHICIFPASGTACHNVTKGERYRLSGQVSAATPPPRAVFMIWIRVCWGRRGVQVHCGGCGGGPSDSLRYQCPVVVLSADSGDGGHMSILSCSKLKEPIIHHSYTSRSRPHRAGRMGIRTVHCTAKSGSNFIQTLYDYNQKSRIRLVLAPLPYITKHYQK